MATKYHQYASDLYTHMAENAKTQYIDGTPVSVWTGFFGTACRSVGMPKGTDRRVIAPLESMECINVIERGVAKYPSVVVLIKPPTEELWERRGSDLTSRPTFARVSREVEEIKRTLGGGNLVEALLNLDRRLTALEVWRQSQEQ